MNAGANSLKGAPRTLSERHAQVRHDFVPDLAKQLRKMEAEMRRMSLCATLFLMGFSVLIALSSVRLGIGQPHRMGPGFLPFLASLILFVLSCAILVKQARGTDEDIGGKRSRTARSLLKPSIWVLAICGYALLLEIAGFIVTTFFFMSLIFFTMQPEKRYQNLLVPAGIAVLSFFIFRTLLKVILPTGIFRIGW
jgi:putative tricarboxylic transport membrane protein